MYLIEVFPIVRGIAKEKLSYFSANAIAPGSLVRVPLRNKAVNALVVSSRNAKELRSEIRGEKYELKKVAAFKSEPFLTEAFMKASSRAAGYYAGSIGSVLNLIIPKSALEEGAVGEPRLAAAAPAQSANTFERLILQTDKNERLDIYRGLVREEFARNRSVFICVPTAPDAGRIGNLLSKGIEHHTFVFHSLLPKKTLEGSRLAASQKSHPILIVATGHYFPLAPGNTSVIIVEEESSRFYKIPSRPFPDFRLFAEWFAKELGARVIFGDTLLRIETLFGFERQESAELNTPKFRSLSSVHADIVDMRALPKTPRRAIEIVSPALADMIADSVARGQHCLVLAARRGLSSQTICADCGETVTCGRCRAPVTLHTGKNKTGNFFFCHHCGERRSAEERCNHCHSWKLTPLGIGIELVEKELRRAFPALTLFRVDKDNAPTPAKIRKIIEQFYAAPGSVIIGTETVLPYLSPVENTAVASLDALFSLPDFRIRERIFHLLVRLRELTSFRLIAQTRINDNLLEHAIKGDFINFYREELSLRERFNYPPYATLIKISLAGTRAAVEREMNKVRDNLKPLELELYPAFIEEKRGLFTMHGLMRLSRGSWPDYPLAEKLNALPPQFRVEVDPESLL